MSHRFTIGLLVLVVACNFVLLFRSFVSPPISENRKDTPATTASPPRDDGFVELRFRFPRGASPASTAAGFMKPGSLVNTQNLFDVAIEGTGFFQITLSNGEMRYTRRGQFRLNSTGNLTTAEGYLVSPGITIPTDAVSIAVGADGTVSVQLVGAVNASTVVGQLTLARFVNPDGLEKTHERLLKETTASGCPIIGTPGENAFGLLRQGFQEQHRDEKLQNLVTLLQQIAEEGDLKWLDVRWEP